ncbi:hypothetical protein THC_0437 [Caldimicrobium thiodismutans]|uniref:Uncharacterized protein n=1 Tax=Caldimicrobium thiodismutans TaxID=1653476 RepID=A0A0U5B462_9BACT|nr:hypothetical protein [Caldimicrobium thiodismutans]BAU22832.1 hypothetical protein THC_0437 [Caldimicrobium thiodismutans]
MPWEDIAEALTGEVKREIAENYFTEKLALEKAWTDFEEEVKAFSKKEEALILNVCRLVIMLEKDELIQEFEKLTQFPLKSCYYPEVLKSSNIRRRLFQRLGTLPFGLTSKSRFTKLFLKLYEDLFKTYKEYIKNLKDLDEEYLTLKEETQAFYKRFDLPSILNFFSRLTEGTSEIATPQEREKTYEELVKSLKISIPEAPSKKYELYPEPRNPGEITSDLIKLAKKAFELHQASAKEVLSLVSKKD